MQAVEQGDVLVAVHPLKGAAAIALEHELQQGLRGALRGVAQDLVGEAASDIGCGGDEAVLKRAGFQLAVPVLSALYAPTAHPAQDALIVYEPGGQAVQKENAGAPSAL